MKSLIRENYEVIVSMLLLPCRSRVFVISSFLVCGVAAVWYAVQFYIPDQAPSALPKREQVASTAAPLFSGAVSGHPTSTFISDTVTAFRLTHQPASAKQSKSKGASKTAKVRVESNEFVINL